MGKVAYRVKNWKSYNRALINRGNLTLWISEDAIESWYAAKKPQGRGRPFTYSDACIELALTLRTRFRLPLRSTQGFLDGLTQLMKLELKIPHYTQLSRRAGSLQIDIRRQPKEGKLDLVIDSTGFKIYGEGEWKMRIHGKDKRRIWRKFHVAVDPETHEVVAMKLTEANVHDSEAVPDLMKGLENQNLGKVYGDGAYPLKPSMDAIASVGGYAVIPPRSGTCIVKKNPSPGQEQRNRLIRERREAGGKKAWKKISGYHRRSLVETHMFRQKVILGERLHSRCLKNQKIEASLRANILNRMAAIGMPKSCKIAA
jgi:endonuclease YncB( thermonuclease family)